MGLCLIWFGYLMKVKALLKLWFIYADVAHHLTSVLHHMRRLLASLDTGSTHTRRTTPTPLTHTTHSPTPLTHRHHHTPPPPPRCSASPTDASGRRSPRVGSSQYAGLAPWWAKLASRATTSLRWVHQGILFTKNGVINSSVNNGVDNSVNNSITNR